MKQIHSLALILLCFSCTGNKKAELVEYPVILSFEEEDLERNLIQDLALFYSYIDNNGSITVRRSEELPPDAREVKKFHRVKEIAPDSPENLVRASIRSNETSEVIILNVSVCKKEGDRETVLLNAGDFEIGSSSSNDEQLINKILNYITTSTYKVQD